MQNTKDITDIAELINETVALQEKFDDMLEEQNNYPVIKSTVSKKKAAKTAAKLYLQFDEIYGYLQDDHVLEQLRNDNPTVTECLEDYLNNYYINDHRGLYLYFSYFGEGGMFSTLDLSGEKGKFYSIKPMEKEELSDLLEPLQFKLGFQYINGFDGSNKVSAIGIGSFLPIQADAIDEFVKTTLNAKPLIENN